MTSSRSSESTQLETGQGGPKTEVAATPSIHSNHSGKIEAHGTSPSHQKTELSAVDIERQEPVKEPAISKKAAILLFVGLAMASFLASLDGTIIATALPRIASDFSANKEMSWVATAYLLTFNAFQPLYGKFSDIFGRKAMILFACVTFMVGSAGAGGAKTMTMLIVIRAIQGLGGSGLLSIVLIIISDIFALEERAKYQSVIWSVFGVSFVVGPLLGGVFDSAQVIALFCVAFVLIAILMWIEYKALEPIIPPRLFKNATVTVIFAVNFLTGMSFLGVIFYAPIYFQVVKGVSATASGLHLLPMVLGLVFSSIASGVLMVKVGDYRYFVWLGTVLMSVGCGLCILFDAESGMGPQIGYLLIVGMGIGLILQTCMLAAQAVVNKEDMAIVTALCGFMNSIGGGIGIAMCTALFNNHIKALFEKLPMEVLYVIREFHIEEKITTVQLLPEAVKALVIGAYVDTFQFIFKCITPIACSAFLMSLFIRKLRMLDPSEIIMAA
ncbi:hypothetical protein BGZ47_010297 [Haplosporangium gracile]|nr:hypothetical protein BGZ47_010297 [Haplosporangium gracile]